METINLNMNDYRISVVIIISSLVPGAQGVSALISQRILQLTNTSLTTHQSASQPVVQTSQCADGAVFKLCPKPKPTVFPLEIKL